MSTNKNDLSSKKASKNVITGSRNSMSSTNKKVVTFNQTLISSQDNQSSDVQSKSSKFKSKKDTVAKKRSIDEIGSDKGQILKGSHRVTSQQKDKRGNVIGSEKSQGIPSSQQRERKSVTSAKTELDSRTLHVQQEENGSINIVKSSKSPNGSTIKDDKIIDPRASIGSNFEMNASIQSKQEPKDDKYADFCVNPDFKDDKFDQPLSIPIEQINLDDIISDKAFEKLISDKKQARKKMMQKRLTKIILKEAQLKEEQDKIVVEEQVEEPKEQAKEPKEQVEEPKVDIVQVDIAPYPLPQQEIASSRNKEIEEAPENQIILEQENVNDEINESVPDEIDLIKDEIGDEISQDIDQIEDPIEDNDYEKEEFDSDKEVLIQSQESTKNNDKQEKAPTVSILKVPMSSNTQDKGQESDQPVSGASFQKQISIKSKKTVCISEEPNKLNDAKKFSDKKQFEVSIESAESFEEIEPHISKQENSIISEEDSAFEDQTPHAKLSKEINNFSSGINNIKKQDPQLLALMAKQEKTRKRSLINTKKSSSNHDNCLISNDLGIKSAAKRQQTLQREQKNETKSPLRHNHEGSFKSKGVLSSQYDQESIQGRKSKPKTKATYLSSNQKDLQQSSYTGDINQIKKQTTQDEKRGRQKEKVHRGIQDMNYSRDTSLNLTVDNQMDHLSVNFGAIRNKKYEQSDSREKEIKQGTFSIGTSQNGKSRLSNKRKSSLKNDSSYNHEFSRKRNQSNKRAAAADGNISFSFRSKDSIDPKSQSIGPETSVHHHTQKSVKLNQNGDEEFDISKQIQRANKKMVNVYLQKPYEVLTIQQIRQKEKDFITQSPARLYQAENILKVHTPFRRSSRDTKARNVFHKARLNDSRNNKVRQQIDKKSNSKDSNKSKVMVYNITWRSNGEQQVDDYGSDINVTTQQSVGLKLQMDNQVANANKGKLLLNQSVDRDEKKTIKDNSSMSQFSDQKLNHNSAFQNSSLMENNPSVGGVPSNLEQVREMIEYRGQESNVSLRTDCSNEKEFWSSLYDQLLNQLEKRIEVVQGQISFHSKTKDLCNIYGQTFTSINFGNASYSPGLAKFEKLGPLKSKSKNYINKNSRNQNINADMLQPLLAISKDRLQSNNKSVSPEQDNGDQSETVLNSFNENFSNSKGQVKISKLNLTGLPQADFNEHYLSDKVQQNTSNLNAGSIMSQISPQMTETKQRGLGELQEHQMQKKETDTEGVVQNDDNQVEVRENNTEPESSWFQKGQAIQKSEGENSRMDDYVQQKEPDLLKLLLQNTDKMGYSHQQLRLLRDKGELLQRAEKVLSRQIKLKQASKTKTQSIDFKNYPMLQMNGEQNDSGTKDIKSFYPFPPEPQVSSKFKKDSKKQNINSNLAINKQLYANKLNEHMMPKNSFITQKLNNHTTNKVLTSKISQISPRNFTDYKQKNENETVEDYFGNKVNMRRSIELKLHYDAKGFKKSGNNRNNLQQNFQSNDAAQINSKDMRVITVSKINNKANDAKNNRLSQSYVTCNKLGKTTNFIQENKVNLLPGQILSQLERNRAALPNVTKNRSTANRKSQKNSEFLQNINVNVQEANADDFAKGESNISSRKHISGSQVPNQNYNLAPLQEEASPIRNQRNRFIEENHMKSKKRLIQSGQHVLGKMNNININNSGQKLDQNPGTISNTQLNHQFKNFSPRLPNFKNNLAKMSEQNYDLDQAIQQISNYPQVSKNQSQNLNQNQLQTQGSGISSSQYGLPTRFNHTKQSQILQGFLNQQRIFNRMINNAGVQQRSNNNSKIGMNTGYSSNDVSDVSNQKMQLDKNLRNSSLGYNTSIQQTQPHGFIGDQSRQKNYNNTQINLGNELVEEVQGEYDRSPNDNLMRHRMSNTQIQEEMDGLVQQIMQQNHNNAQPGQ